MNRGVGIWHVGLTVRNLDRSIAFYRDVIGMTLDTTVRSSDNPTFQALTNNPEAVIHFAWMRCNVPAVGPERHEQSAQLSLQLVEYEQGGAEPVALEHSRSGSCHLSILVEDVQTTFATLSNRGDVPITSRIVQWPGALSFYVADPDGVPVEFYQSSSVPAQPGVAG